MYILFVRFFLTFFSAFLIIFRDASRARDYTVIIKGYGRLLHAYYVLHNTACKKKRDPHVSNHFFFSLQVPRKALETFAHSTSDSRFLYYYITIIIINVIIIIVIILFLRFSHLRARTHTLWNIRASKTRVKKKKNKEKKLVISRGKKIRAPIIPRGEKTAAAFYRPPIFFLFFCVSFFFFLTLYFCSATVTYMRGGMMIGRMFFQGSRPGKEKKMNGLTSPNLRVFVEVTN